MNCCYKCPARRLRCHVWGECVHWMNEQYATDERRKAQEIAFAGAYGASDTYRVNPHFRDTFKRGKKGQGK